MLCFASLSSWLITVSVAFITPSIFSVLTWSSFVPAHQESYSRVYLWGLYSILPTHLPATTLDYGVQPFQLDLILTSAESFPSLLLVLLRSLSLNSMMRAEVDSLSSILEALASKRKEREAKRKSRQSRQTQLRVMGGVGNGINNLGKSEGRTDISQNHQIPPPADMTSTTYPHFFCHSVTVLQLPPQRL